jgi:hypothetical protein
MRHRRFSVVRIVVWTLILQLPTVCVAQDPPRERRPLTRATAEVMVQPSGPLRLRTPSTNTPEAWRAHPRLVGTYSNYANRNTYVLPAFWSYLCSYGYGGCFGYGYGFGRGFGGGSGWGLVYGYSTW